MSVCLAGNFEHEKPTPEQVAALQEVLVRLKSKYRNAEIVGHRDISRTACPGKYLYEMLEGGGKIGERKGEEKIKVYAHNHKVGISIGGKTYSVNASEIPTSVLAALMNSGELTLSLIK